METPAGVDRLVLPTTGGADMYASNPPNPNWPSKVPNVPSGGGRGNNPPKK